MNERKVTALVILENHFAEDEQGNVWCERVITYEFLKRYLSVFDNIIICGRFQNKFDKKKYKNLVSGPNVSFLRLPDFRGAKGIIKNYFTIRKIIKGVLDKIDCVIMRTPTHLSFITYKLFEKKRIPYAVEFVGSPEHMGNSDDLISKLINFYSIRTAKNICKSANGVSYVTKSILQKKYPCRAMQHKNDNYFTTNYSSIDLKDEDYYYNAITKAPDVFNLINVSYMDTDKKGHITMIKAAKQLVDDNYENFRMFFIGDGIKKAEFEKMVAENNLEKNIIFLGAITDKREINNQLRNAHIYISPSYVEGLPRSIIEAMSNGLTCVASPVDGTPELLDNEYLINELDYKKYAEKIEYLMNNWNELNIQGKRNFEESQKYKSDILNRKRQEFYLNLRKVAKK